MKYDIVCILLLLMMGCGKEDELSASYADKNWFILEDSDDPVDHELFLLYQKYGIPVFVNDTIGKEERGTDGSGNPIIYHHVLDIDYTLDQILVSDPNATIKNRVFSLIEKDEDKMGGISFLDEYLLPSMPKAFYFHSVLLTDTLIEIRKPNKKFVAYVHQAMNTLVVGWVPDIVKMGKEEKEGRLSSILQSLALSYLKSNTEKLNDFYLESSDRTTKMELYDKYVQPTGDGKYSLKSARFEEFGFLNSSPLQKPNMSQPVETWRYRTPKKEQDLEDFVGVVFAYPEEEFNEKYSSYSRVINKYTLIRGIILDLGYSLK